MSRNIMKLIMIVVVLAGAAAAFADPNIPILASIDFDDNDATGGGVLTAFGTIGVFQLRDPITNTGFDPDIHTDAELYVDGAHNYKVNFDMQDEWQMTCTIRSHKTNVRSVGLQLVAGSEMWEGTTGELLVIIGGNHWGLGPSGMMGWYIPGTHGWNANGLALGAFNFLQEIEFKFTLVGGLFTIQKKIVGVDAGFVTILNNADASDRLASGFVTFNAQDGGSYLIDDIVISGAGTPLFAVCGDSLHPFPDKDLNMDCVVDIIDLGIFAHQYWLVDVTP